MEAPYTATRALQAGTRSSISGRSRSRRRSCLPLPGSRTLRGCFRHERSSSSRVRARRALRREGEAARRRFLRRRGYRLPATGRRARAVRRRVPQPADAGNAAAARQARGLTMRTRSKARRARGVELVAGGVVRSPPLTHATPAPTSAPRLAPGLAAELVGRTPLT